MKRLGGTIFPATTAAAGTEEDIDYDDENEDSPASTIVPPSPTGSRRNSLMHDGTSTEESEDSTTNNGDNFSTSIPYREYDEYVDRDGDIGVAKTSTDGPHFQSQSYTSHTRNLPHHREISRGNLRGTASGIAGVHEVQGNYQRSPSHQGPILPATRGDQQRPQERGRHEKLGSKPSPPGASQTPRMEERVPEATPRGTQEAISTTPAVSASKLHPRVAVILGVDRKWYLPLVVCRAMSVGPALWWGLRCAFTFLAELLRIRPGSMWREGWVAIVVSSAAADWDVERRFRVTEVALAIMWVCNCLLLPFSSFFAS